MGADTARLLGNRTSAKNPGTGEDGGMPTRPVLRAARSRALRAFNKKVRNTARTRRANAWPVSPTL